jgi:hypothetical protein
LTPRAPVSRAFAENERGLLLLAQTAAEWKVRPSEMLGGSSRDYQIDLACAVALWRWRVEMAEIQKEEARRDFGDR